MKFQRCEKYKDSEIDWIGKIPEGWNIKRIKDLFLQISVKSSVLEKDTYIPLENIESFSGKLFKKTSNENNEETLLFEKNDLLFNKLRPYLGKVLLPDFNGGISTEAIVMRAKKNQPINNIFFFYRFLSTEFIFKVNSLTTGVKMPRTNPDRVLELSVLFPIKKEQTQIAAYLDKKTTLIDKKIKLLKKKKEKYQELEQVLINNAVTRGLDKNVELRESGIGWVGEIPKYWEVKRIKEVITESSVGGTPSTNRVEYWEPEELCWLDVGDVQSQINTSKKKISFDGLLNSNTKMYKKGDLLITIAATVGEVGILNIDACFNQGIIGFKINKKNFNKYIQYFLIASKGFIKSKSRGTTFFSINQGILNNTIIVMPSRSEQIKIANYLDEKTQKIDKIIKIIVRNIELQNEFRKTLINDVITGKIKAV
jgi:type I restriction enzyme, S subunit